MHLSSGQLPILALIPRSRSKVTRCKCAGSRVNEAGACEVRKVNEVFPRREPIQTGTRITVARRVMDRSVALQFCMRRESDLDTDGLF